MNKQTKSRLQMVALLVLFALPLGIALLLSNNGWQPQRTRSSGILVNPPRNLDLIPVTLSDGKPLQWQGKDVPWTLLALPGEQCAVACLDRLEEILRMRITLGHETDRLRVVYLGPALPSGFVASHKQLLVGLDVTNAFASERAQAGDPLALALVDPQGLMMMRYTDDYAATGVRSDIKKIIY
ncbi:MAG: hypothetical protein ABI304_10275 [Rudaea sp.]